MSVVGESDVLLASSVIVSATILYFLAKEDQKNYSVSAIHGILSISILIGLSFAVFFLSPLVSEFYLFDLLFLVPIFIFTKASIFDKIIISLCVISNPVGLGGLVLYLAWSIARALRKNKNPIPVLTYYFLSYSLFAITTLLVTL
jgi:hypothetical protein